MRRKPVRKFKETVEIRGSFLHRLRSHRFFHVSILVATVIAAGVLHTWQRVRVLSLVQEVQKLKNEQASLTDDAVKLRAEIAGLSMVGRIQSYAEDSLGLKPAGANRIYTLVRKPGSSPEPDDLSLMIDAIERVSAHLPIISENEANAGELRWLKVDTTSTVVEEDSQP